MREPIRRRSVSSYGGTSEKAQHTWEYVSILRKQQTAKQFAGVTIRDRDTKEAIAFIV